MKPQFAWQISLRRITGSHKTACFRQFDRRMPQAAAAKPCASLSFSALVIAPFHPQQLHHLHVPCLASRLAVLFLSDRSLLFDGTFRAWISYCAIALLFSLLGPVSCTVPGDPQLAPHLASRRVTFVGRPCEPQQHAITAAFGTWHLLVQIECLCTGKQLCDRR